LLLLFSLQIGTGGTFDAEDYRQSLAANVALQQQIKEKRHGSAAQEGDTRNLHENFEAVCVSACCCTGTSECQQDAADPCT
jgi:hypothetical protein